MVSKNVIDLRNLFMMWARDEIKTEEFTKVIRSADKEDIIHLLAALNGAFQATPDLTIEVKQ